MLLVPTGLFKGLKLDHLPITQLVTYAMSAGHWLELYPCAPAPAEVAVVEPGIVRPAYSTVTGVSGTTGVPSLGTGSPSLGRR